jgi:hydrogenase maturation factor
VQFVLRNPHSFVDVDVTEKDGTKTRYVVEWAAPAQLAGKVDRETLKPGDHVIITGSPGRNTEDHRVRLLTFRRPKDASHPAEWTWGLLPDESFK